MYVHRLSGVTISTTLVNARLTTFDKIHDTNPRELEMVTTTHTHLQLYTPPLPLSPSLSKDCESSSSIWDTGKEPLHVQFKCMHDSMFSVLR